MNILYIARIGLMIIGVCVGLISASQTFSHVTDPTYQVPNLAVEEGSSKYLTETHSNYHAFREFMLTLAVLGLVVWASLDRRVVQSQVHWIVIMVIIAAYILGWWLPWPLFDLRAPGMDAVTAHAAATVGLLGAGALLHPRLASRHA